ncbi:MAG: choice-of-anchor Q domain-containing protein [Candidatus Omnitrophota bacterium]
MRRMTYVLWLGITVVICASGWAVDVEVNKSGAVKTIQDAVNKIGNQGGTITITDSGVYEETVEIGSDMQRAGQPITLTSTKKGAERPVISPLKCLGPYVEANKSERKTGLAVFIDGSFISNIVLESNPEAEGKGSTGPCAAFIMADNVVMDNVLIRPRAGTSGCTDFPNSAVFLAQEGAGESAEAGGRNCNGFIARNCEFLGVATDGVTEPDETGFSWLKSVDNGQFATFLRTDHYTNSDDQNVVITVENCTFKYSYDAGIFFSNRSGGKGKLTLNVNDSFFDAFGKFQVGVRGCWLNVDRCRFSRACQGNHGDGENSAIRIQEQNGRIPDANISNSLFVNCGGAFGKKAYYGGVNNHNAGTVNVNHCTFDLCLSGVTLNNPKPESVLNVGNCLFTRIGYNSAPALDEAGFTLDPNAEPYILWFMPNFDAASKVSAVFNNYTDSGNGQLNASNCLVFDIADETTWEKGVDPDGTALNAGTVNLVDVQKVDPKLTNRDIFGDKPYELTAGSPAIDKAIAAAPDPGSKDLDGSARIANGKADIGAQEFGATAIGEWPLQ